MNENPYEGEILFDEATATRLKTFAVEKANGLKVYAPDEVDEWFMFEKIADVNIWQDPDERVLRAAAYKVELDDDGEVIGTETDTWHRLFDVQNIATNYFEAALEVTL